MNKSVTERVSGSGRSKNFKYLMQARDWGYRYSNEMFSWREWERTKRKRNSWAESHHPLSSDSFEYFIAWEKKRASTFYFLIVSICIVKSLMSFFHILLDGYLLCELLLHICLRVFSLWAFAQYFYVSTYWRVTTKLYKSYYKSCN